MKETQYAKILAALRKAGKKGCTNHDLMLYSNCPWKRIREMFGGDDELNVVMVAMGCYLVKDTKQVNGRTVRVYRLEKV